MKNLILIIFLALFCVTCKQTSKPKNESESVENPVITALSSSKYTIGDSVRIGFGKPVSKLNVKFDGRPFIIKQNLNDSLRLNSKNEKPGWHQLVVSGIQANDAVFSDTIAVELISDIVPQEIKYTVVSQFPHQKISFTEGLEFHKGELYESTGEYGKSQLLRIDLKTGISLKSIPLDKQYFGEGVTIVEDKIYQLTWTSGLCFRYNLDFSLDKTFTYYFQGWGLTHRDTTLMMSDGSNKIHFYNTFFDKIGDLEVYDNKGPVRNLNELEYVNGFIYANIFETSRIVKIDAETGKAVGYLNMENIVPADVNSKRDVLNGIAYQPNEDAFYVTGKNWPLLFKIHLNDLYPEKRLVSLK